ncbi:MAG TPA: PfkB family carbohydrate kinase [Phycisphaerae bacterium]|nr:PfkB family carbohydrate kinase [Phycisphaerae bacterium]
MNEAGLADNSSVADKIVNKSELLAQVAAARAAGQTIVHCHGCFDIVHPGHVRYLEFARRQGDLLIVSLTGDAQVAKGDQRPYIPEELRAENLAALEVVGLVYINPQPTAVELLKELRADVYVKGREYEKEPHPDFAAEREVVEGYGGRVVFSSGDVVFSSTRLIESMDRDPQLQSARLGCLCGRHSIDRTNVNTLIDAFAGLKVLVVGDVILDRYVMCDATDLASEAPMMTLTRLEERRYVGGAGIVARHLAGLGAKTFVLSTTATDAVSDHVRAILENESIQARLIPCRASLPEKTRYLVETSKLFRVEDGQSQPLDSVAEREAIAWAQSVVDRVNAVIFCDFGYGTITAGLLDQLRTLLGGHRHVVTADVSGQRGRLLGFRDVNLLCPTERELRLALHDFENGLSNVAWTAMDTTRARHMLVTLGKKGVVVFDRQSQDPSSPEWRQRLRSEYLPSLAGQVTDPLGCGDALLAVATLTLAAGGNLMQAAYLGSAAAAIEIKQLGNVPLDAGSLRRWLAGRIELGERRALRTPPPRAGLDVAIRERRLGPRRIRVPVVTPVQSDRPTTTLPRTDRLPVSPNKMQAAHEP